MSLCPKSKLRNKIFARHETRTGIAINRVRRIRRRCPGASRTEAGSLSAPGGRQSRPERVPITWNHVIDKDTAQFQRVGACPNRKSRATFSGHALNDIVLKACASLALPVKPRITNNADGHNLPSHIHKDPSALVLNSLSQASVHGRSKASLGCAAKRADIQ